MSNGVTRSVTVRINDQYLSDNSEIASGSVTLTVSNNVVLTTPKFGDGGAATVNLETTKVANGTEIGVHSGTGTLVLATQDSKFVDQGDVTVGKTGTGRVVQSQGVVQVAGSIILGKEVGSTGNYDLSGGTLKAGRIEIGGSGSGTLSWTGGTIETPAVVGNLVNQGGTLIVSSNSTMTITGNYSQDVASTLQVRLHASSLYGVSHQSSITYRIQSTSPAADSRLMVTGALVLGGTLSVSFGDYTPQIGDRFQLFSGGTISGVFSTVSLDRLSGGMRWDTSTLYTDGSLTILGTDDTLLDSRPLNYPNPFRMGVESSNIRYTLNDNAPIELRVYTTTGRELYRTTINSGDDGGKVGSNSILINAQTVGQVWPTGIYPYLLISEGKVIGKGKMAVFP